MEEREPYIQKGWLPCDMSPTTIRAQLAVAGLLAELGGPVYSGNFTGNRSRSNRTEHLTKQQKNQRIKNRRRSQLAKGSKKKNRGK